ncbi:DUF3592 domain-containing protein [Chitinophaga sp. G-6-1-13]|uniref:DUF3592 domain-containing protein n=1 Tax=Chitinophaga fulva TaxID=2728842 RepID=A0A848GPD7_9BACT|nr:DUF3592 domain-containing protein [Chitinophaga fulva]NML40366.1 DUF3592 domain-containing protein [Chitinophaga fulva]
MRKHNLCLLAGLILVVVSLYKLRRSVDFITRSEEVRGTVTSLVKDDDAYSPVFTINTKEDGQIIYYHAAASSPSAWDVGEEAGFLYERGNPDSITMKSYFWLFGWSIVLMGFAIPLLIVSIGYLLLRSSITRLPDA